MSDESSLLGCGKVDLHCHILPKRWPDLKEVCLIGSWCHGQGLKQHENTCSDMVMVDGFNWPTTVKGRQK